MSRQTDVVATGGEADATRWRSDVHNAPRDRRWVLILDKYNQPTAVYWGTNIDGSPFGWTSDGGDLYEPVAWAEITDLDGLPCWV